MSRIAIIGFSEDNLSTINGGGAALMRTQRFKTALISAGHTVELLSPKPSLRSGGEVRKFLKSKEKFDGIIAISMEPALAAVRSKTDLPIWIDLNGCHLAEMQLRSSLELTREILARTIHQESLLLRRGDHFSTVSPSQRVAVIGELMVLGALDGKDVSHEMVSSIEHCALSIPERKNYEKKNRITILSSGSFNLWFDADTLFDALEMVMTKDEKIDFISMGGAVPHSPHKYEDFKKKVSGSKLKNRMRICSWVDEQELDETYKLTDIAVYTDIPCYEAELGARTRVLDWISKGIPVVCTRGAGISLDIERHHLGIVVNQQDPKALASAISTLIDNSSLYNEIVENQIRWCREDASMEKVFAPLLKWAGKPVRSPFHKKCIGDNPVSPPRSPKFLFWLAGEYVRSTGLNGLFKRILQKLGKKEQKND